MLLKEKYEEEIRPTLLKELDLDNPMEIPEVKKVVVNMGISEHENPRILEGAMDNLKTITGQQPVVTRARQAVSDFDIRKGVPVGCKVTLRGVRGYEFLNKLFHVVLPTIRDFRGLSPDSFDGRGNYTFGIDEQLVFPELSYEDTESIQGMDITIVTTAETDQGAYYLLKELDLPFRE